MRWVSSETAGETFSANSSRFATVATALQSRTPQFTLTNATNLDRKLFSFSLSLCFFNFWLRPFSMLFAAFWSWNLSLRMLLLQHFMFGTFLSACYLQHLGAGTFHFASHVQHLGAGTFHFAWYLPLFATFWGWNLPVACYLHVVVVGCWLLSAK